MIPTPPDGAREVERNDPCWCGSGKKYKRCHLDADLEGDRARGQEANPDGAPAAAEAKLFADVIEAALESRGKNDFAKAGRLYFGDYQPEPESPETSGFLEYYAYSYRGTKGRTPVEEYLRRPGLTGEQRRLLESWANSRYGLFEVQHVDEGSGVTLRDLLAGDRFFVADVSASKAAVQWDCLLARVEELDGLRRFGHHFHIVPRTALEDLLRWIDEQRLPGQGAAEFVRANSHRLPRAVDDLTRRAVRPPRILNAEGDILEFCSAVYTLLDQPAARHALSQEPELEREDTGFAWLEITPRDAPRRSYGSISIRDGKLRLECNSRARLQRGRQLIEKRAGAFLRHLGDSVETVARALGASGGEPRLKPESRIPPEVEQQLLLEMKAEHYAKWPEAPLPALESLSPRQAVKTPEGRRKVEELIRLLENREARAKQEGGTAFDFSPIRDSLGL